MALVIAKLIERRNEQNESGNMWMAGGLSGAAIFCCRWKLWRMFDTRCFGHDLKKKNLGQQDKLHFLFTTDSVATIWAY